MKKILKRILAVLIVVIIIFIVCYVAFTLKRVKAYATCTGGDMIAKITNSKY